MDENRNIGSMQALLSDARIRIKESEERSKEKINEAEKRIFQRIDELDSTLTGINNKQIEWLPLITNLTKNEENKRNLNIMLITSLVTNIAAWILVIFIYFIKNGVIPK